MSSFQTVQGQAFRKLFYAAGDEVPICGQKINSDQHWKMAMFGVTHVIAMDGYSPAAWFVCLFVGLV